MRLSKEYSALFFSYSAPGKKKTALQILSQGLGKDYSAPIFFYSGTDKKYYAT
ncbi:hypothetical protein FLA_6175 [Filimonas lacunae]|nr:hypothetical protein FLA_6175 [Filimonas lacunae]